VTEIPGPGRPLRSYLAGLTTLFVVAAVVALWSGWVRAERDALSAARADAAFGAGRAAEQIGEGLATVRSSVDAVASNPGIAQVYAQPAACRLSFSLGAAESGHLDVLSPDGTVVCSSQPPTGQPPGDAAAYRGATWLPAATRAPQAAEVVTDARTGRPALMISAPVAGLGVVAAFVDLAGLGAAAAEMFRGAHDLEFAITTRDGATLLTRWPDGGRWAGTPVRTSSFVEPDRAGDGLDVTGRRRVYGQATAAEVGWRVFAGADRATALAAAHRLAERQAVVVAIGLLAGLLATLLVYRRITRPIGRLRAAVRAAEADALTVSGPREVAELGVEFAALLAAVREHERKLRQSERLESLGQLAAGVAHDFNNLLGIINGYATMSAADAAELADGDPAWAKLRDDLLQIVAAGDRAAGLTRQLLAFARADPVAEPGALDLNDVVAEVELLLRRAVGEHVVLKLRLGDESWPVKADVGRLEQVLMNLAINARDAMPHGGTLTIETDAVTVDDRYAAQHPGVRTGRYMRLRVSDTGSAMTKATLERAFEPFFTTKPQGQGTGLGLATIYGIITQAGGHAQIASELGHGTTITALLPAAESPPRGDRTFEASGDSSGLLI